MMRRSHRFLLAVLLSLLAGLIAWSILKTWRAWTHLDAALVTLKRIESSASPELLSHLDRSTVQELQRDLDMLQADLTAIQDEIGPFLPLTRYLGWIPVLGGDIQSAPHLLEVAQTVVAAGDMVFEALEPMVAAWSDEDIGPDEGPLERLVPPLVSAQPKLELADVEIERAIEAYSRLSLGSPSPRLQSQLSRLDRYLPLISQVLDVIQMAPWLLGAEERRNYLVIAQNSDELRATGGFVSGVGLIQLENGRFEKLTFQDSYAVYDPNLPHPPPPLPLQRHMMAEILLFRDANWSPDFPTAAQALASLYALDEGVAVDGVLAFDVTAVEWLVSAVGPLSIDDSGLEITGQNVLEFMKAQWASPEQAAAIDESDVGDWWQHRKDFMGLLLDAMLVRLQEPQGLDLAQLATVLQRCMEEKHLLVNLDDAQASEILGDHNWDGALRSDEGDFLMVVDTNVGFNKVNPRIQQSIAYQVHLQEWANPMASLTIHYEHTSTAKLQQCDQTPRYGDDYDAMMDRCYFDYVRVYVPWGTELVQASGFEPGSLESYPGERDTQVFAGFFVLQPGEEHDVTLAMELPAYLVSSGAYRLLIQKQPGTASVPLSLSVSGAVDQTEDTTLTRDRSFEISLPRK